MSRTIRRIRDKRRNKSGRSHFDHHWTYDWVSVGTTWKKVKLEGKEFDKAYWRFHSDCVMGGWGNATFTRQHFENRLRMLNKQEIQKYLKDHEYEVILYKPFCLSWED